MSHVLNEADSYDLGVRVPDNLDTDYIATVPAAFQALANRTNNIALTLGASTFSSTFEGVAEADVLGVDTTGANPFYMPQSGRADYLRNFLMSLAAKTVGLRQVVATNLANATSTFAAITSTINSLVNTVNQNTWGFGRNEVWTWKPVILFGVGYYGSPYADGAYWHQTNMPATPSTVALTQTGTGGQGALIYVPAPPKNARIDYVEITCTSPVGHGGSLPATMPTLSLYADTGIVATGADPSASAGAYEALHTIRATAAGSPLVVPGSAYLLYVTGENSTNAQNNSFTVYSCRMALK